MILVRRAEVSDFDQIDSLQKSAFPGDALLMSWEEVRDRCTGKKPGALLVAAHGKAVVAYCVLTDRPFRPWTGWDFLAVDPASSRLGIATKLTGEVFRSASRPFIRGFVRSTNTRALAHYRKWGFIQTGRKRAFYSDGDDAIVLLGQNIIHPDRIKSLFSSH